MIVADDQDRVGSSGTSSTSSRSGRSAAALRPPVGFGETLLQQRGHDRNELYALQPRGRALLWSASHNLRLILHHLVRLLRPCSACLLRSIPRATTHFSRFPG